MKIYSTKLILLLERSIKTIAIAMTIIGLQGCLGSSENGDSGSSYNTCQTITIGGYDVEGCFEYAP